MRVDLLILSIVAAGNGLAAAAASSDIRLDPRTPYFELRSDLDVGDHGEQLLDVSFEGSDCGVQWRFDHAEIKVVSNRFGDVQFVGLPQPGCLECDPIRVRWMHEPTGHLEFRVNVFRRPVLVSCSEEPQHD